MEETSFDPVVEINRAARSARTENDSMELDDLVQELWVFYLEHGSIQSYSVGQQVALLRKEARKRLAQERVDYMYFSGAFIYTPALVRELLAEAVWTEVDDAIDVDGRVDIKDAFAEITAEQQQLLFRKYALGEGGGFTSPQRRACERAVDKITNHLNGRLVLTRKDTTEIN